MPDRNSRGRVFCHGVPPQASPSARISVSAGNLVQRHGPIDRYHWPERRHQCRAGLPPIQHHTSHATSSASSGRTATEQKSALKLRGILLEVNERFHVLGLDASAPNMSEITAMMAGPFCAICSRPLLRASVSEIDDEWDLVGLVVDDRLSTYLHEPCPGCTTSHPHSDRYDASSVTDLYRNAFAEAQQ